MSILSGLSSFFGTGGVPGENNSDTNTSDWSMISHLTKDQTTLDPSGGGMFDFLGDSKLMSSYAGLGSALASVAALPSQIDFAKMQTKMLKHNLGTAKEEQARRNTNIASFNRPSEY